MKAVRYLLPLLCALLLAPRSSPALLRSEPPLAGLDASVAAGAESWGTDMNAAMTRAGHEYRPALILFSTRGCGWCKRLKNEVFTDPEVAALLKEFVRVEVDVQENGAAAQRFAVRGVPAVRLLRADGQLQNSLDGYADSNAFKAFLKGALNPEFLAKKSESLPVLKLLETNQVPRLQWPEVMLALGDKGLRRAVHERLLKLRPSPKSILVELLSDPRLAVRMGAVETLEEIAGDDFGFDPWLDPESNSAALRQWAKWAGTGGADDAPVFGALTEERLRGYLQDLASDNRERCSRAIRMLQGGGQDTVQALARYLNDNPRLPATARMRIREAQYALTLPTLGGSDPMTLAHHLVFGTVDSRIQAIGKLSGGDDSVLPVLKDFLGDDEPLLREAAADALVGAVKTDAVPLFAERLKTEKDTNVVEAILRAAGRGPSPAQKELARPWFTNSNEDLALAAIESAAQGKGASESPDEMGARLDGKPAATKNKPNPLETDLAERLSDPRWRIRVATVDAIAKLQFAGLVEKVQTLLNDPDPFVRTSSVHALAVLARTKEAKASVAGKLGALFASGDELKPAIVRAFETLSLPIPKTFGAALKNTPPDVVVSVLDGLAESEKNGIELAAECVASKNTDVASTALRILAKNGLGNGQACRILADVLHGKDLEKIRTILPVLAPNGDTSKDLRALFSGSGTVKSSGLVDSLVNAFVAGRGTDSIAGPVDQILAAFQGGGRTDALADARSVAKAVEHLFQTTPDADARRSSALFLARVAHAGALEYLDKNFAGMTSGDRGELATVLSEGASLSALPLLRQLLGDRSEEIRRNAANACTNRNVPGLVQMLLDQLAREDALLTPQDVFHSNIHWALRNRPVREAAEPHIRAMISDRRLCTLGLILIQYVWNDSDLGTIKSFCTSQNPWQRRAALMALACFAPDEFLKNLKTVTADPSEYVRLLVPEAFNRSDRSEPVNYLDQDQSHEGAPNLGLSSARRHKGSPPPEVFAALQALIHDTSNKVRIEAFFGLLKHRQTVDLNDFVATLNSFPDRKTNASRVSNYLTSNYKSLSKEFAVLLPFLTESRDDAQKVIKHLGGPKKQNAFNFVMRKRDPAPARYLETGPGQTPVAAPESKIKAVYFYTPGCSDCEKSEQMFERLTRSFPQLEIARYNLRQADTMRFNEALCDRFDVPGNQRLVAPSIFTAAGFLVKTEVTYSLLAGLVERSRGLAGDRLQFTTETLVQAGSTITQRYAAVTVGVILVAGLLDALNPCALATIIFFVSYLQVARRGTRQTVQAALAFIAGLFVAYFALGLGLVEVVGKLAAFRDAGRVLNGFIAVFALVITAVCIRDGVLCMRGRMADTALQLPEFLKSRIHVAIRTGTRHSRFIAAAFLTGIVVSCMELACTGQIYVPTILYMVQSGQKSAVLYLVLYNLGFVAPLILIFLLALAGVRNEAFIRFQKRHTAAIKFVTAALFLTLSILLLRGML